LVRSGAAKFIANVDFSTVSESLISFLGCGICSWDGVDLDSSHKLLLWCIGAGTNEVLEPSVIPISLALEVELVLVGLEICDWWSRCRFITYCDLIERIITIDFGRFFIVIKANHARFCFFTVCEQIL
jgi:hypothetical protein